MQISSKTQYAVRALIYLYQHSRYCPINEISAQENIPYAFLEKIFQRLKSHQLVKVKRGAKGGYMIVKPAAEVSLHLIYQIFENHKLPNCLDLNLDCQNIDDCRAKKLWKVLHTKWIETLKTINLGDVI